MKEMSNYSKNMDAIMDKMASDLDPNKICNNNNQAISLLLFNKINF